MVLFGQILLVVGVVIFIMLWFFFPDLVDWKRKRKEKPHKNVSLSYPSRRILKEYNKIPAEYRPFDNIEDILFALDIKHQNPNGDSISRHFHHDSTRIRLMCWCSYQERDGMDCGRAQEYYTLHDNILNINKQLNEQRIAFEIAGVSGELEKLNELNLKLISDSRIIKEVTDEYR